MVTNAPKTYENDQWTLELEELGFQKEAVELARMILHCRPPFAVCVRGRWGSGKTSIMRYAMARLGDEEDPIRVPFSSEEKSDETFIGGNRLQPIREDGWEDLYAAGLFPLSFAYQDKKTNRWLADKLRGTGEKTEELAERLDRINCVWFSPWRYQNDPNPMVPLLHTLRNHFSLWAKTRATLDRVGRAVVEAGLDVLGHLADAAAGFVGFNTSAFSELPKAARQALEKLDVEQLTGPSDTERFNLLFEHAVGQILGVKLKDADAQKPKAKAKTSKEANKKNHRLVIFIDDLDRCEGEKAVRLLEAIKLYLSTKHCVFVLGVDQTALEQEVRDFWPNRPSSMACDYLEKLFQASVHVPMSHRYSEFIEKRLVNNHLTEKEGDVRIVANILAAVLEPNPRKVKNFLNTLFAAIDATEVALNEPGDLLRFALIQRLKLTAPNTYGLLAQGMVEQHDHLRDFFAACTALPPGNPPFHKIGARDTAVFMADFGHLVPSRGLEEHPGELGLDAADLLVRLGKIRADFELAKIWFDNVYYQQPGSLTPQKIPLLTDFNTFKRLMGLPVDKEPVSESPPPTPSSATGDMV